MAFSRADTHCDNEATSASDFAHLVGDIFARVAWMRDDLVDDGRLALPRWLDQEDIYLRLVYTYMALKRKSAA